MRSAMAAEWVPRNRQAPRKRLSKTIAKLQPQQWYRGHCWHGWWPQDHRVVDTLALLLPCLPPPRKLRMGYHHHSQKEKLFDSALRHQLLVQVPKLVTQLIYTEHLKYACCRSNIAQKEQTNASLLLELMFYRCWERVCSRRQIVNNM